MTTDGSVADGPDTSDVNDAGACPRDLPDACTDAPSYSATLGRIIQTECAPCHYAGSTIAKFDFSTYAGVSTNAGAFLGQLYSCHMPPPDSGLSVSLNEREELLAWLVCGAPNN
jgi:hypothetical protein